MNTDLRKKAKNDFDIDFFKLMNISVFKTAIENVKKDRDIKLARKERRENYLVSEPNYRTTTFFTEHLLPIEMKKIQILVNVSLGLSILGLSKILMYEFWYDYVKPKYCEKEKLPYMDIDSFIAYIKKQMMFIKTLQKMVKLDLKLQIMN